MVVGSSGSRRAAASASSRWCRTSVATTASSAGGTPIRRSHGTSIAAPAAEWFWCFAPPIAAWPLPMSWKIAASSSRSGRDTWRTSADAFTAVCIRCRSTVNTVDRVPLRHRPQPLPAGQQRGDQPGLVEVLPGGDHRLARPEQREERVERHRRPRLGQRRAHLRQPQHGRRATPAARPAPPPRPRAACSVGSVAGIDCRGPGRPRRPARRCRRRAAIVRSGGRTGRRRR